MNVVHVSKYYYPEVGGLEHVVRSLAEGFAARGHDLSVLAAVPRGTGSRETINGVDVHRVGSAGELLSVPTSPAFPTTLTALARDADLLHVHLPNPLAVGSHLLTGGRDTPVVVTYHSDIVKQATALSVYRPVLARFLDRADRILPTSPTLLANSTHLEPFEDKCEVVPLSIDLDAVGGDSSADADGEVGTGNDEGAGRSDGAAGRDVASDPPREARNDGGRAVAPGGVRPDPLDGTDTDRPTLLFVGRLSYYKGVEFLLDAMASVDADLLVVGDGERRDALERHARARGVDDAVAFLGRVPDETLERCYGAADVFVLPSVAPSEAFGIVQLEAMAHGLPVVNTDLPTGVPWVSPDGETGLTVPPRDAGALADALNALVEDPGLRARYGENARDRVHDRFGRERMLDRTAAVYEAVVDA